MQTEIVLKNSTISKADVLLLYIGPDWLSYVYTSAIFSLITRTPDFLNQFLFPFGNSRNQNSTVLYNVSRAYTGSVYVSSGYLFFDIEIGVVPIFW